MKSEELKVTYVEIQPKDEDERLEFERRINRAFDILFEVTRVK